MLIARINEKKAELENLKELRDLSAGLASQMQTLEDKLSTLSDGAEGQWKLAPAHQAVATVLSNWHTVLQAINMASSKFSHKVNIPEPTCDHIVKLPKAKPEDCATVTAISETTLPHTLVRIPVEEQSSLLETQEHTKKGMTVILPEWLEEEAWGSNLKKRNEAFAMINQEHQKYGTILRHWNKLELPFSNTMG
ncbi:MAG: hypothetical protein LQ342_001804 [Letrouitia transgressa]|nr:MAG: hypothetical protein LQ342_001804 [Letrouitia transgressa]